MAKGYLIAQVTVTDPEAYAEYSKAAGDLLKRCGARLIINPDTLTVVEGSPKNRTVIFEFDSFSQAKSFWDSTEYAKAKAFRTGAAEADFMLVEGLD
ncbi:DUF1330 domain-containing protein [Ochrobactrum chromiisoli]|uniref:DUF1330 domain-containing protein n=1 Tax=Ochrobactrum chromiisoli TaxID=2993941 RepID=A0ABT3QSE6_9HYPH|nr:DUF1330 domain-containing protein [Ochrobactrum chromiisoli]MCX2698543.1 DUF1330 domain-containing protein [Ochrobactrum chromiisoli]